MTTGVVFGCIATTNYLPIGATLLEYFAMVGELEVELKNPILQGWRHGTQGIPFHLGLRISCWLNNAKSLLVILFQTLWIVLANYELNFLYGKVHLGIKQE